LYSALPRESQWPSSVICVLVHRFSQSASFCSAGLASSRTSPCRDRRTSSSGRRGVQLIDRLRARTSSSVSARGAGAGGGGGGGGAVEAAAGALWAAEAPAVGAAAGTFLWQPP
jgi:hypothetical protein